MDTMLADDSTSKPSKGARLPKCILMVDDEPLILDLLVRSVNVKNCHIALASDGVEAWERLKTSRYDCIILDMKMPRMTGQELYQALGKIDPDTAKKIIFITGVRDDPQTEKFLADAPNMVFRKPFVFDDLWDEVNRVLEKASLEILTLRCPVSRDMFGAGSNPRDLENPCWVPGQRKHHGLFAPIAVGWTTWGRPDSYTFGADILTRLRGFFDGYFSLRDCHEIISSIEQRNAG